APEVPVANPENPLVADVPTDTPEHPVGADAPTDIPENLLVADAPASTPESQAVATVVDTQPAEKGSWLTRLKQGLSRTGQNIGGLVVGVKVDEALFEELETALIMADAGMEATQKLLTALRARVRKERLDDAAQVKIALREIL